MGDYCHKLLLQNLLNFVEINMSIAIVNLQNIYVSNTFNSILSSSS